MSVKASPVSKTAATLIIVLGIFVLLTGIVAGALVNEVFGAAFIVLGLGLYGLLLRFTRKLRTEVSSQS